MKATGIVRRVDDLGRIVIPKEIRRTLRIREGGSLTYNIDIVRLVSVRYCRFCTAHHGEIKCMETAADHQTGGCDYLFDKLEFVKPVRYNIGQPILLRPYYQVLPLSISGPSSDWF